MSDQDLIKAPAEAQSKASEPAQQWADISAGIMAGAIAGAAGGAAAAGAERIGAAVKEGANSAFNIGRAAGQAIEGAIMGAAGGVAGRAAMKGAVEGALGGRSTLPDLKLPNEQNDKHKDNSKNQIPDKNKDAKGVELKHGADGKFKLPEMRLDMDKMMKEAEAQRPKTAAWLRTEKTNDSLDILGRGLSPENRMKLENLMHSKAAWTPEMQKEMLDLLAPKNRSSEKK